FSYQSLVSGAVQYDICAAHFLSQRHLVLDASKRFASCHGVAMFEPGDLRFAVGGDDDDDIHALMGTGFKQERHFVHDDGMRSAFGDTTNETLLFTRYPRM